MATKNDIIKAAKSDDLWLKEMQTQHIKRVEEAVKTLQQNIVNDFKLLKTQNSGKFLGLRVNLAQAQAIHKKLEVLFAAEWNDQTFKMTEDYLKYKSQIKTTYGMVGESMRFTSIDTKMMNILRDGQWQHFYGVGDNAKDRIVQAMYNDIIGQNDFSSLVGTVTGVLEGGVQGVTGTALVNRARLYARDGIMNFMREVHVKKSQDIGIDRFIYMGDIIKTTRPFCRKRAGKTYTIKQINSWKYKWAGKSGPAMTHCGGWNCRHHWRGVRPEWLGDEEGKINI